jgi:hypothetical protein
MEDSEMQTKIAKPTLWFGIAPALLAWAATAASLAHYLAG